MKNLFLSEDGVLFKIIRAISIIICALLLVGVFVYMKNPFWDGGPNSGIAYSSTLLLLAGYSAYLVLVFFMAKKLPEKVLRILGIVFFVCFFAALISIVVTIQVCPDVDLNHSYDQALSMLKKKTHVFTYGEYFSVCTNNIPHGMFVYWMFFIGKKLGVSNFRLLGGCCNVVGIMIAVYCLTGIVRRCFSKRAAFFVLCVLAVNPVLYAYCPYYYTDTLSLPFLAGGAYLLVIGLTDMDKKIKSSICLLFGGLTIGLATTMRVTSAFFLIAILVYGLFSVKFKKPFKDRFKACFEKVLTFLLCVAIGFILSRLVYYTFYNAQIDFETRDSARTATHYLMMGAKGNGSYDDGDVAFTSSFDTHEEKVENNMRVYRERIKNNGFSGNLKLIKEKETLVWGPGTHGYLQYIRYVTEESALHQFIMGENSKVFLNYCFAYNMGFFILMIISLLLRGKDAKASGIVNILAIYFCGAVLFYVFWESHPRHSMVFTIMCTILFGQICNIGKNIGKKGKKNGGNPA